jgi:NTP pyrophosphatase (non-canonical NTP hydrolase)
MRDAVYDRITYAREMADVKWGRGTGSNGPWLANPHLGLAVLAEEFGEVARGILERDPDSVERELYDVAQVCVAWLEAFEASRIDN